MRLNLTWTNPTPHPGCGFKALYRRKGDLNYSEFDSSGSTSGTTSVSPVISAPANYEGYIQSNCCSDNLSLGTPFGINTYETIGIVISVRASPVNYIATITSTYANPYATVITGTYTSNLHGVTSFSVTYPANSTSAVVALTGTPNVNSETVSNTVISTISPTFNGGGTLQQFDAVNTPPYFEFTATSGQTSGTTLWNGSPAILPSFTLDTFNVTETNVNAVVLAGELNMSWIAGVIYKAGVSPYNSMSITVTQQSDSVVLGTLIVDPVHTGLRQGTLTMTKGTSVISTATQYTMRVYWGDNSLVSTNNFYLPSF